MAERFPLEWPDGWDRTAPTKRRRAPYSKPFGSSRDDLIRQLRLFRATATIISSNMPVRSDGIPYAGTADKRYADPGVAVYFALRGEQQVIACDCWDSIHGNLRAIGITLEAMRQIDRTGASSLLRRAFQGFKALPPAPAPARPWWEVLGLDRAVATREVIEAVYKARSRQAHPDAGGSNDEMAELNRAREEGITQCR